MSIGGRGGIRAAALVSAVAAVTWMAVAATPAHAGFEHAFTFGEAGSGQGQLGAPHGIAVGPDGNLYVADQDNDRIQVFGPDGAFVRAWGSSGSGNGELSAPRGIAVSPAGEVYVVDRLNDRVQVFSSSGTYLRKWGSPGTAAGRFNSPGWVDLDSAGNVYVTDTFNYRVQVFTSQGAPLAQFGSQGAAAGQFSLLSGIAVTADGVYVADHTAARLQLFSPSGTLLSELGGLTNPGLLVNPWGIAEDTSETLLVAEPGVATGAPFGVSRVSRTGAALDAFGPPGIADDELSQPRDIAVTLSGDAYVTDADLSQVKVFTPVGGGGPQTAIDSGPSGPINTTTVAFAFSSPTASATFECSIDAGGWAPCGSPLELTELAPGGHSLAVRALHAGEADQTPAVRSFMVDLEPPDLPTINTDAEDPDSSPDVDFALMGEQGASFECRLDGAAFEACGALRSYTGLDEGEHVFEARQTDAAGNVGEAGQFSWLIDLTPPETSLSAAPPEWLASTSATFGYASNEPGSTFSCTLDGTPIACSAPEKVPTGLAQGAHAFTVKAIDAAGNQDAGPETASFNVDTVAPSAPGLSGPSGAVGSAAAAFDIAAEAHAALECGLDSAPLASCPTHNEFSGLAQGPHQFRARQTDRAGNVSPVATRSWTVDTIAPTVTILTHPEAADGSTSPDFTYSVDESQATFQCRLDGGAWVPCAAAGHGYDGLALGAHTFAVRAVDAAGNVGEPDSFAWEIVPNAPPEAKAVAKRIIPFFLYKLDGRGSVDPDGEVVAYEWRASRKSSDPGKVVSTAASFKYRTNLRRTYVTLTVTDDDGATGEDRLVLTGLP